MKLNHLLTAAAIAAMALTSCEKQESLATSITVDPATISASMDEHSEFVTLTTDGSWTASSSDKTAVLAIKPSSGGAVKGQKVEIMLSKNTGVDRTITIDFGSSKLSKKSVVINQAGEKGADDIETISCADFISKADTKTDYRLVGEITSAINEEYCSFDMNDGTATVVVWTVNNKDEWKNVVKKGGTVTVHGKYQLYTDKNGNSKHEMVDAYIDKFEPRHVETVTVEGLVMAVSAKSFVLSTAAGIEYVYADALPGVKVGDMVRVEAEAGEYNGLPQYENPKTTIVSMDNAVSYPDPAVLDAAALDSYNTSYGFVKFSGSLVKSGNYVNIDVDGATRKGSISYPVEDYADMNGRKVDLTGYFVGISGNIYFNIVIVSIELSADQPDLTLAHPLTSGVTWTLGNKAYDKNSSGNNAQTATVNATSVDNLLKLGTTSAAGDATLHLPAGATKLGFYSVGFSKDQTDGKDPVKITVTVEGVQSQIQVARYVATGNPPYSLTLYDESDYYEISFDTLAAATDVKIEASGRCVIIGINAE